MKSFLKQLSKIVTIIALVLLIAIAVYAAFNWSSFGLTNSTGIGFLGTITYGQILLVLGGALVLAGVLSPSGLKSGIERVVTAVATTAEGASSAVGGLISGAGSGLVKGLFSKGAGWLLVGGIALGALLLFGKRSKPRVVESSAVRRSGTRRFIVNQHGEYEELENDVILVE